MNWYKLFVKKKVNFEHFNLCNANHSHNFLFIHIPKTAGTSIAKSLGFYESSHITIKEIEQQLNKKEFKDYYKFCFVRNPWARFLSLYNYARMDENEYHSAVTPEKAKYGKHTDYDLLKNASLEQCAEYLIERKLKHDTFWNHWQPQVNWIKDKKGKNSVDYIGKVENLDEDFAKICKKIGMPYHKLPKLNISKKTSNNYTYLYTNRAMEIVSEYYKEDINYFQYKF